MILIIFTLALSNPNLIRFRYEEQKQYGTNQEFTNNGIVINNQPIVSPTKKKQSKGKSNSKTNTNNVNNQELKIVPKEQIASINSIMNQELPNLPAPSKAPPLVLPKMPVSQKTLEGIQLATARPLPPSGPLFKNS